MATGNQQTINIAGYILGDRIGSGGMGDVYKAWNPHLNRAAAVKMLYQTHHADRFKNEAYIQSSVNHPNIARLYEYVSDPERHCIVMEYVEGESLDALLKKKGRLSCEEIEQILRQIVSALAYLHGKGIIHRDIKPQNFKMQPDGTVKMLDFGIAKNRYTPKFTQLGFIVGTSEYLAPEQLEQKPEMKSDIWALGVMTYELLTGYMPFDGTNPVTLHAQIRKGVFTDPKILVTSVPDKLATIIGKCLTVNPAQRISAEGILKLLDENQSIQQKSLRFSLADKRIRYALLSGAAVILLILLIVVFNRKPEKQLQVETPEPDTVVQQTTVSAGHSIIINTPGIRNAVLVTKDGRELPLPYTVTGNEGERFDFVLKANGYQDKNIQIEINPRRISYEFNLEKNNR